jgi:hypothetical protein
MAISTLTTCFAKAHISVPSLYFLRHGYEKDKPDLYAQIFDKSNAYMQQNLPETLCRDCNQRDLCIEFEKKKRDYYRTAEHLEFWRMSWTTTSPLLGLVKQVGKAVRVAVGGAAWEQYLTYELKQKGIAIVKLIDEAIADSDITDAMIAAWSALPRNEGLAAAQAWADQSILNRMANFKGPGGEKISAAISSNLLKVNLLGEKLDLKRLRKEVNDRRAESGAVPLPMQAILAKIQQTMDEAHTTVKKTNDLVGGLRKDMQDLKKELKEVKKAIQLHPDIKEQRKMTRFMLDHLYGELSTEEKILGIKRGIYPDKLGELPTLLFLNHWEQLGKKVDTVAGLTLQVNSLLQQAGIKVPGGVGKGILAGQGAFHVIKGLATGSPFEVIGGLQGLVKAFGRPRPDLETLRFNRIMEEFSALKQGQAIIMAMVQELTKISLATYDLCFETAKAVNSLGVVMIELHVEVMKKLNEIHSDVLYNREVLIELAMVDINALDYLIEARSDPVYSFERGVFATHSCAQAFFTAHIKQYESAMLRFVSIVKVSAIHPLLRFEGVYSNINNDAQDLPGTNRFYFNRVWGSTHQLWQSVEAKTKEPALKSLFEPYSYADDLPDLLQPSAEASETMVVTEEVVTSCFPVLLAPAALLKFGNALLEFYSYDEIIKDHQTGALFTIDEMLAAQQAPGVVNRGIKLMRNLLHLVHLGIAQQHVICGGPLISVVYDRLFKKISSFSATPTPSLKREETEGMRNLQLLLQSNPIFHRNFMIYAVRKHFGITNQLEGRAEKCLEYRFAFNQPTNAARLAKLFTTNWKFVPSTFEGEQGWSVSCPLLFPDTATPSELQLRLPHPSDLFEGSLHYSHELLQLIKLKERIVFELAGYDLVTTLPEGSPLRQSILENMMSF